MITLSPKTSFGNPLRLAYCRFSSGNKRVFGVMLISAAFVTLLRILGPVMVHIDLSVQLEAAYRYVQGLGLTNAFHSQFDLNQPPISEYLTRFPPGLSLLVAAFLYLGFPLAITLKCIYSLTTIIGWIGWASIASCCLIRPLEIGRKFIPTDICIAALLPIFYTPSWTKQGTDILLWAGIPFFMLLLLYPFGNRFWLHAIAFSGLILAFLISFRYAGGFLFLAALLIIPYVELPNIRSTLIRYGAFCLSFFACFLPTVLYVKLAPSAEFDEVADKSIIQSHLSKSLSQSSLEPGSLDWIFASAEKLVSSLSDLYTLTGIYPGRIESMLERNATIGDFLGFSLALLLIFLCFTLIKNEDKYVTFGRKDIPIALLLVLISFVLFSCIITFLLGYSLLGIGRYYIPVNICLILIAYRLVTLNGFYKTIKRPFIGLVLSFILYNGVFLPLDYFFDSDRDLASLILASGPSRRLSEMNYPSNEIKTSNQEAVNFLKMAERLNPDALFFIQKYPYYMNYYNFMNPSNFRKVSGSKFWENAYLSRATKTFWIINDDDCPSICNARKPNIPIDSLSSLPNLKTVFVGQSGRPVIMTSELPAGYRFSKE